MHFYAGASCTPAATSRRMQRDRGWRCRFRNDITATGAIDRIRRALTMCAPGYKYGLFLGPGRFSHHSSRHLTHCQISMPISNRFAPRRTRKASTVSPEGGLALVAEGIHARYASFLPCKSCSSSERERKGNYVKNLAGKRDGEDRYYRRWCCTTNGKFACPTLGNAAYIEWAKTQLGRDAFRSIVERVRTGFEDKGPEHCRLGLLLQEGPSPTVAPTPLKRKATAQATPPSTKRRLHFFAPVPTIPATVAEVSGEGGLELSSQTEPADAGVVKVDRIRSSPLRLIDSLVDARAKLDEIIGGLCEDGDRTRENSLSPEEYLGIHEAKGLALRAVTSPPTPPSLSSPIRSGPLRVEVSGEDCRSDADVSSSDAKEEEALPLTLASKLAADFHSADGAGKKAIRARARQNEVTAAFEQEVCRIGSLARRRV